MQYKPLRPIHVLVTLLLIAFAFFLIFAPKKPVNVGRPDIDLDVKPAILIEEPPEKKTAVEIYREADYLVRLEIKWRDQITDKVRKGQMSGMLVKFKDKIIILSAAHIENLFLKPEEIKAYIKGRPEAYTAVVDKLERENLDCAVLKITDEGFGYEGKLAELAPDRKFEPGVKVYSLGSPQFTEFAIGEGIVMSLNFGRNRVPGFIWQSCVVHSATIAGGNSGGPLVNENGQVIGINVGINTVSTGLGYAVYIDDVFRWLGENY